MAYKDIQKKRDYQNKWAKENRAKHQGYVRSTQAKFRERVAALKLNPCVDCGFIPEYAEQMDWDHINDDKIKNVSQLRNCGGWDKVLAEIAKCELVCANCHRKRTVLRRTRSLVGQRLS